MLWVKANRGHDVTFVGALYHPSKPLYGTNDLLDYIEALVAYIRQNFADAHLMLAGDFNQLSDNEVVIRTGLSSRVTQPTRLNNILDRLYVSDFEYPGVTVVQSVVTSDHKAIIAYNDVKKFAVCKTRWVCTFRKHTALQHARFLANLFDLIHIVSGDGDPQDEFDKLYAVLLELLNTYYPERTVTITSAECTVRHTWRQAHAEAEESLDAE